MTSSPWIKAGTLLFAGGALAFLVFRASTGCTTTQAPQQQPQPAQPAQLSNANPPATAPASTTAAAPKINPTENGNANAAPPPHYFPATKSGGGYFPEPQQQSDQKKK